MAKETTTLGGLDAAFPSTSLSLLKRARDRSTPDGREALDALCARYWKPVFSYIRSFRACPREEGKDLTQDFFMELVDGKLLERYLPHYGSFRGFLRGALKLFVLHCRRKAATEKRGGGRKSFSIDDGEARKLEERIAGSEGTPEEIFDRQWAAAIMDQGVADLRLELIESRRHGYLEVFERYDQCPPGQTPPTYGDLAKELGLKESDVSNRLTFCRRRLKELVVARIREYSGDEKETAAEYLRLFSK